MPRSMTKLGPFQRRSRAGISESDHARISARHEEVIRLQSRAVEAEAQRDAAVELGIVDGLQQRPSRAARMIAADARYGAGPRRHASVRVCMYNPVSADAEIAGPRRDTNRSRHGPIPAGIGDEEPGRRIRKCSDGYDQAHHSHEHIIQCGSRGRNLYGFAVSIRRVIIRHVGRKIDVVVRVEKVSFEPL